MWHQKSNKWVLVVALREISGGRKFPSRRQVALKSQVKGLPKFRTRATPLILVRGRQDRLMCSLLHCSTNRLPFVPARQR